MAEPFSAVDTLTRGVKKPPPKKPVSVVIKQPQPAQQPVVAPPSGKPVPLLQNNGMAYLGGIEDFNKHVEAVVAAHKQAMGTTPSAHLVYDVVRAGIDPSLYGSLFKITSRQQAQAVKALGSHTPTEYNLSAELAQAVKREPNEPGAFNRWAHEHKDDLKAAWSDPAERDKLINAGMKAGLTKPAQIIAQGFLNNPNSAINKVLGGLEKPATQITSSLVYSPYGVYLAGRAGALDVRDTAEGHPTLKRTAGIAKQVGEGIKRDISDPRENSGFLFLDALGLLSAGAGGVARAGAAGKAIARGEAGAAAKALVSRPVGGTAELTKGGHTEHVLLSDNPLVSAAQKIIVSRRQNALTQRHLGDGGASVLAWTMPDFARTFLERQFSAERKLGRETDARKRVELTIATAVQKDLEQVAGWSVNQAQVFSKLPKVARRGLTRGEQKAIFSLSIDDVDPIAVQREFHQRMIDRGIGDPVAHRRQIADLKLAEKVLQNPRGKFLKALDLTREVVAEMERVKIQDLGLSPVTAESRVANLGHVLREEPHGLLTKTESSFYMPTVRKAQSKRAPKVPYRSPRIGQYGVAAPQPLPELTHEFTGDAIRAGDIRIDATGLVGEAYGRTVRAATIKNDHANLWKMATDTRRSEYDRPIRSTDDIPDKLREIVAKIDEGEFTAQEAEHLDPTDVESLLKHLYPGRLNKRTGRYELDEPIEGVKWVDERTMPVEASRMPFIPGPGTKIAEAINEPFRAATLFLRPAYILNALGNAGILLMHEGVLAPPNVFRALYAEKLYGARSNRALEGLVGNSRTLSFTSDVGAVTKVSQTLAHAWSKVADNYFRKAALIHELRRMGFKTKEEVEAALFDTANRTKLVEAVRRGNKAMVEFDNQTWFEKNYLRHFIFVYPWTSRSVVWSLRTLMEHPVQVDVLAHLGDLAHDEQDPVLSQAPDWFKRTGYFPVGWTPDGKPKLVNPTSINTFSTLEQLGTTFGAGVSATKYASLADLLGPAAKFGLHAVSGKDDFGNDYPGGQWLGAAKDVILGLPQVTAHERANKQSPAAKPLDITNRRTLVEKEHAALKQTVFGPGWLGGYGTLIAGGFSPREFNGPASAARFWRDQPPLDRQAHEQKLIGRALKMQAEFLQKPLPKNVSNAVALGGDITRRDLQFKIDNGRDPTVAERAQADVGTYLEKHLISADEAGVLRKQLKQAVTQNDFQAFRSHLFDQYGGGRSLSEWDSAVRLVASFARPVLRQKTALLARQGIVKGGAVAADQKVLDQGGREFLKFKTEVTRRTREIAQADATEQPLLQAEMRAWLAKQTKALPGTNVTPVELSWAYLTPKQQEEWKSSHADADWSTVDTLGKKILGRPVGPQVADGWLAYEKALAEYRQTTHGGSVLTVQKTGLARQIDKVYPGFYKDFLFSQEPKIRRYESTTPYRELPPAARKQFDSTIGTPAKELAQVIKANKHSSYYASYWRQYVKEQLRPWLDEPAQKQLKAVVESYGPNFLNTLPGR